MPMQRLPGYQVNSMLDLSPISNALTGYQRQMNTNDQLDMQQKRLDMEQTKFNDDRIAKVEQELGNLGYLHLTNPGKYDSKWAGAVQELVARGQKINPNFSVPQEYFNPNIGAHVAISKAGMVPQYLDWQLKKSAEGRASADAARAAEEFQVRRSQVEGMTADERRKIAPSLGITDPAQIEQFAYKYQPKPPNTFKLGLDEAMFIQQPDPKKPGATIAVPYAQGTPKPKPLDATTRKEISETDDIVASGQETVRNLERAISLNSTAYSGVGAGIRAKIDNNTIGTEAGAATAELENVIIGSALASLKATFGAAPTEGERKILLEVQGSIDQPAHVRERIFTQAKILAEQRIQRNAAKAAALRNETYYKPEYQPSASGPPGGRLPAAQQAYDEARKAISAGANRGAVIQRLRENGIDPSGL